MQEHSMAVYEFRTISNGKTIWTAEHCCRDDTDALNQAKKSYKDSEIQVWRSDIRVARVMGIEPVNALGSIAEQLHQRIALYRGFSEDGLSTHKAEFYLSQICKLEDELEQLECTQH
jgi:hypothetical protein